MKEQGGENDLIERVCADPAFGISREEAEALLQPERFVGRAPQQVSEFLKEQIQPILKANPDCLGKKTELSV